MLYRQCLSLLIQKGADKKVIINEAVNFAKKYADNLDYKFVNAVLDKVLI